MGKLIIYWGIFALIVAFALHGLPGRAAARLLRNDVLDLDEEMEEGDSLVFLRGAAAEGYHARRRAEHVWRREPERMRNFIDFAKAAENKDRVLIFDESESLGELMGPAEVEAEAPQPNCEPCVYREKDSDGTITNHTAIVGDEVCYYNWKTGRRSGAAGKCYCRECWSDRDWKKPERCQKNNKKKSNPCRADIPRA